MSCTIARAGQRGQASTRRRRSSRRPRPQAPQRCCPCIEDVTIRPIRRSRRCSVSRPRRRPAPPTPRAFIPPAGRTSGQSPAAHAAHRRAAASGPEPDPRSAASSRNRASGEAQDAAAAARPVGLGRREEQDEADGARPRRCRCRPARRSQGPAASPMQPRAPRAPDPVSEYAKRPAHPGLDAPRPSRRLCIILWKTITSTSRRSCAGRPTDTPPLTAVPATAGTAGALARRRI